MVDCSPAAREKRRQQIARLEDQMYSGTSSISDRSKSVSFVSPDVQAKLRADLLAEEAVCDGRKIRRFYYFPLVKNL
jgi:hypothetical protein